MMPADTSVNSRKMTVAQLSKVMTAQKRYKQVLNDYFIFPCIKKISVVIIAIE